MVSWNLNVPIFSTLILITITGLGGASAQQCGSQAGGALCAGGLCCSQWGWCGNTADFCDLPGCQSQCWGGQTEQCGSQAGGALCPGRLCCSQYGWCGSTSEYCALPGCQSQCWAAPSPPPLPPTSPPPPPPPSGGNISDIISRELFEEMLPLRNNFYTYDAFLTAATFFPGFGTTGDTATRKREIAAFFGQTSHETKSWVSPLGQYHGGYGFIRQFGAGWNYCVRNLRYNCVPGRSYLGRGPIQIQYNYNYGPAGEEIGENLLRYPDLVATDVVVSFKTAIWFWMTEQLPKPSCHDVIIGNWKPSSADVAAGRLPGYGVTTNILNGGLECGIGQDTRVDDRIGFFKRYCDMFGIEYGDNLDCATQMPFESSLLVDTK